MGSVNSGGDGRPNNLGIAARPAPADEYGGQDIEDHYKLTLHVRGDPALDSAGNKIFPIVAALPERYNLNFSSQWNAPFSNTSATEWVSKFAGDRKIKGVSLQDAANFATNLLSKATGVSTRLKHQSIQVWEGSSALQFSVDLIFHAKSNSDTDVRDKHLALLKLAAPSEIGPGGFVLMQPGPVMIDQVWDRKSRQISLQLGKYLYFENVIITGVSSDVETICDIKGNPLSMTIGIEIQSLYTSFTAQDIERAFVAGRNGGVPPEV